MHSGIARVAAAGALAIGILGLSVVPAAGTISPVPDKTWTTNGTVYSVVRSANTIYLGGVFTQVSACKPTRPNCPTAPVAVSDVAALDATTGQAIGTFQPQVRGTYAIVYALAVLGNDLFIGGQFASVDGIAHRNLAAVNLTTGALDPAVSAQVGLDNTDRIRGMVATSTRVYVSGAFATIDGQPRKHLAAFDLNGTLDQAWTPQTDGATHTLALSCDGTKVIAGGKFQDAAGSAGTLQPRHLLAIFDATTGALDPWTPPASIIDRAPPSAMSATCSTLFVGSGDRNRIYAVDLTHTQGTLLWMLTADGNGQAVGLYGDRLLVGGHFSYVPDLATGQLVARNHFAVFDLNGQVQSDWVPSFGGTIHTGVWSILVNGSQIWIGGGYTNVSGVQHWCISRFTDIP